MKVKVEKITQRREKKMDSTVPASALLIKWAWESDYSRGHLCLIWAILAGNRLPRDLRRWFFQTYVMNGWLGTHFVCGRERVLDEIFGRYWRSWSKETLRRNCERRYVRFPAHSLENMFKSPHVPPPVVRCRDTEAPDPVSGIVSWKLNEHGDLVDGLSEKMADRPFRNVLEERKVPWQQEKIVRRGFIVKK